MLRRIADTIEDSTRRPVQGAVITVTLQGTATTLDDDGNVVDDVGAYAPATLYSDRAGTTPISGNVLTSDSEGRFACYVDDGVYHLRVVANGLTRDVSDIYVGAGDGVLRVDSVADLRALPPPQGKLGAEVDGYYAADDGGRMTLVWKPTSNKTDDGVLVFKPDSNPTNGRWERGAPEKLDVRSAGAKTDGSNARARFVAALAALATAGGTLFCAGAYALTHSSTTLLTVPANVRIKGDGTSMLTVSGGSVAGAKTAFNLTGDGAGFEDIGFTFNVNQGQAFMVKASNLAFRGVRLNGGNNGVAGVTFHCFQLDDNSAREGLLIEDCSVENFRYGLLRSNATTGAFKRIKLRGGVWRNNYANHVALNSPNAVMDDVDIDGVTLGDCLGGDNYDGGTSAIMLGIGSASNVRVRGCKFEGKCKDAIHIEELNVGVVIEGNAFDKLTKGPNNDNGGRAIYCVDNDISGSQVAPERFVIADNVMSGLDVANAEYAVRIVRSQILPGKAYILTGNVITSFGIGIAAFLDDQCQLRGNVIQNCTTGFNFTDSTVNLLVGAEVASNTIADCTNGFVLTRGWAQIHDNVLMRVTNGIVADRPGHFGFTTFINVTAPCVTTVGSSSFEGWAIERTGLTVAASPANTVVDLFDFPEVCDGMLQLNIGSMSRGNWVARRWDLNIDSGGTVTATLRMQRTVAGGLSNVATSGAPANNAGKLAVTLTNSDASVPDVYVQATFRGDYALQ